MPKTLSDEDIEQFRDRLCDVAERLFAEHGLEAVTMRQLAGELGVSPMTPYRYFKDKDAILAAVRTRAFDQFAAALEAAHEGAGRKGSEAYIDFALAHPAAYKLMFDVNQPTFADYPELLKAMERARATMTAYLDAQAEAGRFSGNVLLLSLGYFALLHGAVMLQLGGMLRGSIDAHAIAGPMLQAADKGLGITP